MWAWNPKGSTVPDSNKPVAQPLNSGGAPSTPESEIHTPAVPPPSGAGEMVGVKAL